MRIFYIHWHEAEAKTRAQALRKAGHEVRTHWSTTDGPALRDHLPEALIISLDRLPSHGRAVADWLWEAKKRQHIPIIFEGGQAEKVATTKKRFPRAVLHHGRCCWHPGSVAA